MKKTKFEKGITLIALIITIVVLLILAVISIKAVQDGGIITHAQNSASRMNKAQIEEKANLTKLEYTTDCYTNKELKKSIQELRNKIIEAFEVTEDTNNDNIIEVNDKYAIHIKNTDLDIEVVEITNALKASSLISIVYEVNDGVNEGKTINTSLNWTISQIKTEEQYVSQAEKETVVVQKLGDKYGKSFNDLDEAIVGIVNIEFKQNFKEINECLTGLNTTRENLYYAFYNNGSLTGQISKTDFIDCSYKEFCSYTNYFLSVIIDGTESTEEEIQLDEVPYTFNSGNILNNTVYKIVLKNVSGDVVASEVVHVRNLEDVKQDWDIAWTSDGTTWSERYYSVKEITEDYSIIAKMYKTGNMIDVPDYGIFEEYHMTIEGDGELPPLTTKTGDLTNGVAWMENIDIDININNVWEFGFTTKLTINEGITAIPDEAFYLGVRLTEIILPRTLESIGKQAFGLCASLPSITIPERVSAIGKNAFVNCNNLTNIYYKGDSAPQGQPWGAPNATVQTY